MGRLLSARRHELPALQAFFRETRSLENVQALTFSFDEDPGPVLAFMKEKGYAFPVIVDMHLALRLFPGAGIPTTWVIGPNGRRADPFRSWSFGRILFEVERAAKTK